MSDEISLCDLCGDEMHDSYTCRKCGLQFCTECGDSFEGICNGCKAVDGVE